MEYGLEELLPIVKWITEKYTGKESTSVTYEKAEQLMGAVIYCIREFQQKEEESAELEVYDREYSAARAYEAGYAKVLDKVYRAKELYEEIMEDFDDYGNRCLHDTVIDGMPAFFVRYDAKFNPGDHILTLDYPLLKNHEKWCGVDLIYCYLDSILTEQKFLKTFSRSYVTEALKRYHKNYKELFINNCSIVLRSIAVKMLFCQICRNPEEAWDMTEIKNAISNMDEKELENKLKELMQLFINKQYVQQEESFRQKLLNYMEEDLHDFTVQMKNMQEFHRLV